MLQVNSRFVRNALIFMLTVWLTMYSVSGLSSEPGMLRVVEIATSTQCGENAGVTIFISRDELKKAGHHIQLRLAEANIDWENNRVLQVNMGLKPNSGYHLDFPGGARIKKRVLIIPVHWETPQPGGMYAQRMVSPCLMLSIPRQGYQAIQIVGRAGELRWSLSSP